VVYLGNGGAVLLASCPGDQGERGGLFAYDGARIEQVDTLSSTGLSIHGSQLLRLLRSTSLEDPVVAELFVYDHLGVRAYHRLDGVYDEHDILWDGTHYVVVATGANRLYWIAPSGEVVRTWQATAAVDAWHINCLAMKDGDLYVCAFGRYEREREWNEHRDRPTGFVFNFTTGEEALTQLMQPHHPRFVDGAWLVCNSASSELLQIAPTGAIERRLRLEGYTRGLAITDNHLFVGESTRRHVTRSLKTASIAVIRRDTWEIVERLGVGAYEIYDLVVVSSEVAAGVRTGFRTNRARVAEHNQYVLLDSVGAESPDLLSAVHLHKLAAMKAVHGRTNATIDGIGTVALAPGVVPNIERSSLGSGPLYIVGWAIDSADHVPLVGVYAMLDDRIPVWAQYGLERPDVAAVTGEEGLGRVGYAAAIPDTDLSPGIHTVQLVTVFAGGEVCEFATTARFMVD
jgi:uncharacterized protein (TIGR03032 family)